MMLYFLLFNIAPTVLQLTIVLAMFWIKFGFGLVIATCVMCTMPEITRRSSTRCAPLRPRGNNGSIRAHSASLNQVNCLAIQRLPPNDSVESAIHQPRKLIEYGP